MNDLYGPGAGAAFGYAWAASDAKAEDQYEELARIRKDMLAKSNTAFYQEAFKCAAADVLQEIVQELKDDKAGTLKKRHFSDPAKREERNEAYVQAIANHVERISHGKVRVSRASMDRIKNKRTFK